jgi:hypothetical protein
MNATLTRSFTAEEVEKAVAQMQPLEAPGADGFGVCFFHHHWEMIGEAVRSAALNFLNHGQLDPSINAIHVVLIPKNSSADSLNDYHPINLCNILYKIIAKVLANRFKMVIPSIISHNQSAFVQGRLI